MSKVNVRVSGLEAPKSSIDISYGINTIPTARIQIDPTRAKSFVASIEQNKRSDINISVGSELGNLKFEGLLEGISLSQNPGDLNCDVYVKSKFQRLVEVYPKLPGVNPNSVDIFRRTELLKLDLDGNTYGQMVMNSVKIDPRKNVIDFIKELLLKMLELQNDPARNLQSDYAELTKFTKLLEGVSYKKNAQAAKDLISQIDTSATSGCVADATQNVLSLIRPYLFSSGSLWDTLLQSLDELQCCIVIGNRKAFIVPQNNFIKGQATKPGFGQKQGNIPNFAPPATFNNFVFDTSTYKDIGKVYLVANSVTAGQTNANTYTQIGYYEDPQAQASGVFVDILPSYVFLPVTDIALKSGVNKRMQERNANIAKAKTAEEIEREIRKHQREANAEIRKAQEQFGDKMAEITYYKHKYTDKSGSFGMEFNPNWVPGTTGTLYTRHPGFFIDFYVTNVTHRISLSAPNNGTAITMVSFIAGRTGVDGNIAGVDSDPFFNYNQGKMKSVQSAFISDITT